MDPDVSWIHSAVQEVLRDPRSRHENAPTTVEVGDGQPQVRAPARQVGGEVDVIAANLEVAATHSLERVGLAASDQLSHNR